MEIRAPVTQYLLQSYFDDAPLIKGLRQEMPPDLSYPQRHFQKKTSFDESLVSQYFFLINCHPNAHSIVPSQAGLFHYLNEFIFLMFRNQFRARAIQ